MTDNEKLFMDVSANKRVVVFGAGKNCVRFIGKYSDRVNIAYIVDNNTELWDTELDGYKIKSVAHLKEDLNNSNDIFVLAAIGKYLGLCTQVKSQTGLTLQMAYIKGNFIDISGTLNGYLSPSHFPEILLRIETTNRCNFNCTFCTHGSMTRPVGDMEDKLYEKLISSAADMGITNLDLRNFGEPLLDNKLEERIALATERGFTNVFIYTNAFLLTRERYRALSDAGLTHVKISISPKREFELTRKGIPYEHILNNIGDCVREYNRRKAMAIPSAEIIVHIVAPSSTTEECRETKLALKNIGVDTIAIVYIHNWADANEGVQPENQDPCSRLFDSVTVLQDGKVSLCCIDYDGKYILGDLTEDSLAEVINSSKYKSMRKAQLNGNLPPICRSCTNFR